MAYLAMEYIKGAPLSKIMEDRGRIDIYEALEYILPICDAVDCAHQAGIAHRDLKPSNILVESSGRVLVADFGISKILSSDSYDDTLTFVGTPIYMSPEQCGEGQLDHRTDIYSLGVIFYEMVVGHPPFGGNNPAEIIKGHLMHTVGFPVEPGKELPPTIVKILRKMLAKDPEQRHRDMHSLKRDLDMWKQWTEAKAAGKISDPSADDNSPIVVTLLPRKILLGAVTSALKNIDHRLVKVNNSTQLLSKLSNLPVRMVVLGHENGKKNVFRTAETIKESGKNKDVQLMLLTHGISRSEVEIAFAAGISDIIAEPFDPSVLVSKLESVLIGAPRSVECRRFFRKSMSDNITIRIENEILDISEGGMRIATNMVLKIGELLKFELRLFREIGIGDKSGRVVWISKNNSGEGLAYYAGIDFVNFRSAERDRLRKWIFASEIAGGKSRMAVDDRPNMGPVVRLEGSIANKEGIRENP